MRFLVSPGGAIVLSLVGFIPGCRFQERVCGSGVESCVLVVLVGCRGGGSRAQSQAEKVKVGAVAFLAPPNVT